ncbi:GNAT family N-acetyltransferase [Marinilactibacillus kalidii]|uniref:GNAT family N-acetyltransferase n=1 Tax=Marinilactibacillus kalidii TaxID=2820274 RepID=UPI001FC91A04|nr:GNAT family N-acetyltransferase [Marinilactibacillus kalidii]
MEKLTIRTITDDNWRAIVTLTVKPTQAAFISPNAESMLESFYEERYNWHIYGLYVDNLPVGFAMIGAYNVDYQYIWLDRFMIDATSQGKEYGKKFLEKLIVFIRKNWTVKDIVLSINLQNLAAKQLYESFGFKDTGRIDEENGESIFVLSQK